MAEFADWEAQVSELKLEGEELVEAGRENQKLGCSGQTW